MKISKGKIKMPSLIMLYGVDGIGKSTFGAEAPNPIFLGPEKGTNELDVARFDDIAKPEDIYKALTFLQKEKHDYKTLVVDTVDWIEHMFSVQISGNSKALAKACGGYGAGYETLLTEFIKFRKEVNKIREENGLNVILLAHSKIIEYNDPTTETPYHRYVLKLVETKNVSIGGFFREWVDDVLFMNYKVYSKGEGRATRGVGDQTRCIWTERTPAFDAKNRSGLAPEIVMEKGAMWTTYITSKTFKATPVEQDIDTVTRLANIIDKLPVEVRQKASDHITENLGNEVQLLKIEKQLLKRLEASHV